MMWSYKLAVKVFGVCASVDMIEVMVICDRLQSHCRLTRAESAPIAAEAVTIVDVLGATPVLQVEFNSMHVFRAVSDSAHANVPITFLLLRIRAHL
jgi:hypothetical protein